MSLKEKLLKIDKLINKETLRINGNVFRNGKNSELREEIEQKFSKYENIKMNEMIYLIMNDLDSRPICECSRRGEKTFINYAQGYYNFCGKPNVCSLNSNNQTKMMHDRKSAMSEDEKQLMFEKQKMTTLKNHGVDNYFKKPEFIANNYNAELVKKRDDNRLKSVREKYGVDNVSKLESVKKKIEDTNTKKYGVPNYMQTFLSEDTLNKLNDKEWMTDVLDKYSITYVAKKLNCYPCTVTTFIKNNNIEYKYKNITAEESIIKSILDDIKISYETNDKSVLGNNHELDFYIKDKNFAIEVNGLYWHSEIIRPDRNYHQKKYELCNNKSIFLFQFWDYEINNKFYVVESMILNKLNMINNKIFARKCEVKEISKYDASIFIQNNHLQDIKDNQISVSLGIYYEELLVGVMSFKKDNDNYILNRYCSLIGHNVIGGFSKMLKFFTKKYSNNIISYSDYRYSQGNIYKLNGFEKIRTNDVSYHYTKDFKMLHHRNNFSMDKMKEDPNFNYDKNLTDQDNMFNNKYYRVYGCKIDTWKYVK